MRPAVIFSVLRSSPEPGQQDEQRHRLLPRLLPVPPAQTSGCRQVRQLRLQFRSVVTGVFWLHLTGVLTLQGPRRETTRLEEQQEQCQIWLTNLSTPRLALCLSNPWTTPTQTRRICWQTVFPLRCPSLVQNTLISVENINPSQRSPVPLGRNLRAPRENPVGAVD